VAKLSTVLVSCNMEANPDTGLAFRWTFNTTANTISIPDSDVTISGTKSAVKYTPKNEMDFGTLVCWASNSVGAGAPPCVYHLLPIGPPEPPLACSASNVTYSTVKVSCDVKYDKNLPEVFGEVRLSETGEMIGQLVAPTNRTFLEISGLTPGTTYTVRVQIRNKFGVSESLHVPVVTLLLRAGTALTTTDNNGRTPLQLAQSKLKILQRHNVQTDGITRVKTEVNSILEMMAEYMKRVSDTSGNYEQLITSFSQRLNVHTSHSQLTNDLGNLLSDLATLTLQQD